MTATRFPLQRAVIAGPNPASSALVSSLPASVDDAYGDGRLVGAVLDQRSAWYCPIFYLAIPACALLSVAAAAIRMCDLVSNATNRFAS